MGGITIVDLYDSIGEKIVNFGFYTTSGTATGRGELHLHTLLVESVRTAELEVVIAFLDEPLANIASFILNDSTIIYLILLGLHLEVHLFNLAESPTLRWFGYRNLFLFLRVNLRGLFVIDRFCNIALLLSCLLDTASFREVSRGLI